MKEVASDVVDAGKNIINAGKEFVSENIIEPAKQAVVNTVTTVVTEVKNFAADPGGYMKELACDASVWWLTNKTEITKTVISVGAFAASVALAPVTGGASMVLVGAGIGAFQAGLNSYVDQKSAGRKTNWATIGKESLEGGIIGGVSGFFGGAANKAMGPLDDFCGKGTMESLKMVGKKWAAGTAADFGSGTVATYVSNRFDGQSAQEALANTYSSMDDLLVHAAWTNTVSVVGEAAVTPKCFVAGTMVTTAAGLVAIENIEAGDMVLAANEETGEFAYKEVVRTFVSTTDEITHVTIETSDSEKETIVSTTDHPFYVEGKGWVDASALHPGMTIWLSDGTKATVENVSNEGLDEPVTVYNFEVEDFHTYFVGETGVLVHNTCDGEFHHIASDKSIKSGYTERYQEIFDKAGMSLNDPKNIVFLPGHKGAHTKEYKQYVLDVITTAVDGKSGAEANLALTVALDSLAKELKNNQRMPYKGGM